MHILLATGIYPPEIGGPATYVRALAGELKKRGVEVSVVTYGKQSEVRNPPRGSTEPVLSAAEGLTMTQSSGQASSEKDWCVVVVSRWGGPIVRWIRYAVALRKCGKNTDILYAFSSVSVGVPLFLSGLRKPKKVLRLGGDFLWERYTDWGGRKSLREWYRSPSFVRRFCCLLMGRLLRAFDHLVFSTEFQQSLYEEFYPILPPHSIIENAFPKGNPAFHTQHDPMRLLFLGRFVGFKNLPSLLEAVARLPHCTITLVGEGPLEGTLRGLVEKLPLNGRISFLPPVHSDRQWQLFDEHDLLILPSLTEISPHVVLEARVHGLPILLSEETGLSRDLLAGVIVRPLRTSENIVQALLEVEQQYEVYAEVASTPLSVRSWDIVTEEHLRLFSSLHSP